MGLRNTASIVRAIHVGTIIAYHLVRFGDYDARMMDMVKSLSERGPLYVKVLQSLAGSSGLLSQGVQDYITTLTDSVPYCADDERYDYLRSRLSYVSSHKHTDEVKDLSSLPIHSGTVSLVYEGRIGDKRVVVKCVRNRAYADMVSAIEEAEYIVAALNYVPSIKYLNLPRVLAENKQSLLEQTHMRNELKNLMDVREMVKDRSYIVVPKAYPVFTEMYDDILVMEMLEGRWLEEVRDDEKEAYGLLLAEQAVDAIMTDGVYHADLHRGNVLFMGDGDANRDHAEDSTTGKPRIGLIDFGIVGRLTESEKLTMSSFYLNLGFGEYEDVVKTLVGTLTNKDALAEMDKLQYNAMFNELVSLTRDACTSKVGFTPRHMKKINGIFTRNGLQLAPVFCRIEMALAMNASVSKFLETSDRNFMDYIQSVIKSRIRIEDYDV